MAAQSSSQLVRVAAITDSIGFGLWASQLQPIPAATSWSGITRTRLQAQYGDGGSGYVSISSSNAWVGAAPYQSSQLPVTLNGPWINEPSSMTSWGSPNSFDANSRTNGDSAIFTVRGTTVTVYYVTIPSGGSFSVSIDGSVTDSSINTNASSAARTSLTRTVAAGNHTVVITNVGGAGSNIIIQGVDAHNDTGIVLDLYGTPGQSLTGFVAGPNALALSGASERQASLLILELGVNDDESLDVFTAAFNQYTAAFAGVDILYVYQALGNVGDADRHALYQSYSTVIQPNVGVFVDCGTLDIQNNYNTGLSIGYWGFYGNPGAAGTANNADNVHLSDTGHQMVANDVCPYLGVSCQ